MPDGTHYIGELNEAGQPHGQGASFHSDGSPHVTLLVGAADASQNGRWIQGKPHGKVRQIAHGRCYEGPFESMQMFADKVSSRLRMPSLLLSLCGAGHVRPHGFWSNLFRFIDVHDIKAPWIGHAVTAAGSIRGNALSLYSPDGVCWAKHAITIKCDESAESDLPHPAASSK